MSFSCSKQEAPVIENMQARSTREIERLESCTQVNFDHGVLLHFNMLNLFRCAKWNEEFPSLYSAIKRIPSYSWDHVMAPIDKKFIENMTTRDRVFKHIRDLDSQDGLDDLSRVLMALNETNFFDSVKLMFQCVDDLGLEACRDRVRLTPKRSSLKNIIRLVDTSPEVIDSASVVFQSINKAVGSNQEKLRAEIQKFMRDPLFIEMRLKFVDALAQKVRSGLSDEDRGFLGKLLLTADKTGQKPWFYTWIHDSQMSREKFRDLVEFPVVSNPYFVQDLVGLKRFYNEGLECTLKDNGSTNQLMSFDLKTHLYDCISTVRNRDYRAYLDFSAAEIVGLKMVAESCQELESNKYNANFIRMVNSIAQLVGERKIYELMKFLALNTSVTRDPEKDFTGNLYLLDIVASSVFSNGNDLNKQIIKYTREFYPTIFDVVKNLPPEAYVNLGLLTGDFLKSANDYKLRGVSDFWSFFSPMEKNYVFNFIDRHFEGDTNYVLLSDFYAKMLDEVRDVQPYFKEKWANDDVTEEISYQALQDFFYQLAGESTLKDFKTFFGREHILKILEIISSGAKINADSKEQLAYIRSNEYVTQARNERYKFSVNYDPAKDIDYDSRAVLDCLKKYSEIENGFYQLVKKMPEACTEVTSENIAIRLFGWFNNIEKTYHDFKKSQVASDSLFSNKGILSPYMFNTSIAGLKNMDTLLGELDSKLPTTGGLRYLMSSARQHLHVQKAGVLVEKNLDLLENWFNVSPENNLIHRNALLKTYAKEDNFTASNEVVQNLTGLLSQYGDWVSNGSMAKVENRSLGVHNPKTDCENSINKLIAPYACPSNDVIKKQLNKIAGYLTTSWDPKVGSPIMMITKSLVPNQGIDIPLRGDTTKKYRLTLKETFKFLYDTSDTSYPVNRQKTLYVNEKGTALNETLTTLERVQIVINDVRFEENYLGAAFLNAVVHAQDYNKEAEKRKSLLNTCIKIPGIRCSRKMSDSDLRMAKNALEAFDSLLDINNGKGLDARMNYGNYLKTFEQTLVATSHISAQKVQMLPLKEKLLEMHNGRLLAETTVMSTWTNIARVIRDRVGRTREDFDKFINGDAFNRVDKAFLAGFEHVEAGSSADRLLKKIQVVPAGETQNFMGQTVDWVSSLSYEETRLVEDTISRVLLVGAYLGEPSAVFPTSDKNSERLLELRERYKKNNLFQLFLSLEKFIEYWPNLKNYYPKDAKLIDAFKPLNNVLVFVTNLLESSNDPEKNMAYRALNDIFSILQTTLFDKLEDPRIPSLNSKEVQGLELMMEFIKNPKNIKQSYLVIRDDYRYLSDLHAQGGAWFKVVAQNLTRVAQSPKVDLTPIRDYLNFTTKSAVCLDERSECLSNYHFDEVASLIKFANQKTESGETYFSVMSRKLLVENFDQLNAMLDDMMPALKIKDVKAPLRF